MTTEAYLCICAAFLAGHLLALAIYRPSKADTRAITAESKLFTAELDRDSLKHKMNLVLWALKEHRYDRDARAVALILMGEKPVTEDSK